MREHGGKGAAAQTETTLGMSGGEDSSRVPVSGRNIDVTVERGFQELELPSHLVPVRTAGLPAAVRHERGRVRLKVDMPAPSQAPMYWILGILAAAAALFALVTDGGLPTVAIFGGILGFSALLLSTLIKPTAKREILELDSRFATVRRDDTLVGVWGRRQFEDPRLNAQSPPASYALTPWARARWPKIVWGRTRAVDVDYAGGVGAAVSTESATRVLEEVMQFCEGNPPDPDFDFRGAGTPIG